jgi:hypothetical protein
MLPLPLAFVLDHEIVEASGAEHIAGNASIRMRCQTESESGVQFMDNALTSNRSLDYHLDLCRDSYVARPALRKNSKFQSALGPHGLALSSNGSD